MHRKIRRVIFILAALIFLTAALLLVFYSWGYRWDKEKLQLVLTGGLYLKTNIAKPQIYLDGKFLKKATPSLLSSGIFLSNLLPDAYQLEIKKENYFGWRKKIEVESRMVTTFSSIVLLPQNPLKIDVYRPTAENATNTKTKIQEEIIDFLPLLNGKEIIVQTKETATTTNAVLKIYNLNNQSEIEIYRQKLAKGEEINLIPKLIINDADASGIIFDLIKNNSKTFYLWQKIQPEKLIDFSAEIARVFKLKNPLQKIVFYPNIDSKYVILSGKDLMWIDFNKNESKKIIGNIRDFIIKDYSIFWIDYNGAVFSYNLILDSSTPLDILELDKDAKIKRMFASPNNQYFGILFDNGKFYLLKSGQATEEISGIKDLVFAPDSKKLTYLNANGEVRVRFLTNFSGDVIKERGEEILITQSANQKEAKLEWYNDSQHLIIQNGKTIYFAEVDDRDKINIFEENLDFEKYLLSNNKNGTIWGITSNLIQKIDLLYENI